MCNIYSSTDPRRYEHSARSVRLNGFVTSVRLENEFWDVLNRMASAEGLTPAQFISELHDEVVAKRGQVSNLTSLLRVACMVYLETHSHAEKDMPEVPAKAAS